MKIAIVAPHYPPDIECSGTLNLARAEAKSLRDLGHDVHVLAGTSWLHMGRDVVRGEMDGIRVTWLPRTEDEQCAVDWSRPRWTSLAVAELKSAHVAHVFHGLTLSSELVGQLARRMPTLVSLDESARELTTCHPPLAIAKDWRDAGREFLEERLRRRRDDFERDMRSADRLLVSSTRDLERFEESMSKACRSLLQVHQPGLCLEVPKTHDSVRRTPWRGDRPISLLHFGHRRREKGLLDLVQALRELPSGTVELVACGPEKEPGFDAELRAAAAEHFPLHLFGAYDGGQLAALASACDFAAFPSRIEEADALVVDEALALGLPVWASTGADPQGRIQSGARSTSETLESAPGRVLHAADPQTWRAAFEELLSSPEQHEEERAALTWSRGNQRTAQEAASELEGLLLELQAPPPVRSSGRKAACARGGERPLAPLSRFVTEPRPQIDFQSEPTRVLVFALSLPSWLSSGGGAALMHAARGDRVVCVQVNAAENEEEEKRLRQILGERLELRSLDLPPGELGGVHDLVARLGAVLDSVLLSDGETGARFVIHVPAPPPEQLEAKDEDLAALVAALSSALSYRAPHALRVFGSPFAQRHYELSETVCGQKREALEKLGVAAEETITREPCSTLSSERWLERLLAAARVGHGPSSVRDGQMRPLGARSGAAFPRATAVVSTWNKRDDVLANVESLRGQTLPFAEIVVVDNASSDGTAEAIAERFPEVRCVVMPHSEYGACETFNVGFANARTPYLAILDDDIVMSPSWLERATRRFGSEPDSTAIVSTKIVEPGMPESYATSEALNTERYMSTFRGCASLARTDAIRAAGGYDERLFIYGNERDLTCRLLNAGQRVLQYPKAEVFHKTPFGIKMGKRSLYYHARNAFLSMLKYAPAKDLFKLPFLVVTKVLLRSKSAEEAGEVTDATGTIGIGRSLKETPGSWLVLLKAGGSVLWNIPYCLKRREPVSSDDFELPLE